MRGQARVAARHCQRLDGLAPRLFLTRLFLTRSRTNRSRLSALRPLEWARESGLAQCSHTDTDRDVGKTSDDPLP